METRLGELAQTSPLWCGSGDVWQPPGVNAKGASSAKHMGRDSGRGCWERVASQFLSLPEGRRIRPWRAASLSSAPTQPVCCRICVSKPTTWPHPLGQGALCHLWSTGHRSLGCRWSVYGHGPGSQMLVLPEWFDGGIRSPPFC